MKRGDSGRKGSALEARGWCLQEKKIEKRLSLEGKFPNLIKISEEKKEFEGKKKGSRRKSESRIKIPKSPKREEFRERSCKISVSGN